MVLATGPLLALCGVSAALGIRHGFDADHLTVIDGLARRNIQLRPIMARSTGVLFSLGHSALFGGAALVAFAFRAQWRIPSWLEVIGASVSIVFLLALALMNLKAAWAAPGDEPVRTVGFKAKLFSRTGDDPLTICVIGSLFAISVDTLAIAAATSLSAAHLGGLGAVILATASFCLGMVSTGGINGLWISHLIATAGRRAAVNARIMTAVVGLLNLAVGLLALGALASTRIDGWSKQQELLLGCGVVGCVATAFLGLSLWGRLARSRRQLMATPANRPHIATTASG